MNDARQQISSLERGGHETVSLSVSADSLTSAFTAALEAVVLAIAGGDVDGSDRFVPFRAEAGNLAALLAALIESLVDETGDFGEPASARVDGVVRSDDGFVAWGVAELTLERQTTMSASFFATSPTVTETSGRVEIEAEIIVSR